jgi:hypothetical protein
LLLFDVIRIPSYIFLKILALGPMGSPWTKADYAPRVSSVAGCWFMVPAFISSSSAQVAR